MSAKTQSRYDLVMSLIDKSWREKEMPFWTNTHKMSTEFGVSKPTAWRLLEDMCKQKTMFKVQYHRGTFTYSNYIASFHFLKIGGQLPYGYESIVKQWLAGGLIQGSVEGLAGFDIDGVYVQEVFESWLDLKKRRDEGLGR